MATRAFRSSLSHVQYVDYAVDSLESSGTPPLLSKKPLKLSILRHDLSIDRMTLGQSTAVSAEVDLPLLVGVLHDEVPPNDWEGEVTEHGHTVRCRRERHSETVNSFLQSLMSFRDVVQ